MSAFPPLLGEANLRFDKDLDERLGDAWTAVREKAAATRGSEWTLP
jgi:hypothetical protein